MVNKYADIPFLDKFDFYGEIESFDIHALNLLRYAFTNKFILDQVKLKKPVIVIRKNWKYRPPSDKTDSEHSLPDSTSVHADSILADTLAWDEFRESGGGYLPDLNIDKFIIEDADFTFFDGIKPYPIHEINALTFDLEGFDLQKNSDFEIEDVSITIEKVSSLISRNTARLSLSGIELHPENFHIDSLHFGHIVDKYRINDMKGFRASWLNIGVQDIDIDGLHPGQFLSDSTVFIDKAAIGKVNFYLFKDKAHPVINPQYKPLPQEIIRSIPTGLRIDTAVVLDAEIVIDMEAPTAENPGRVALNQTYATITNITNIPEYLSKDPMMHVSASTMIMGEVPISLNYKLKIDSPEDQFWASVRTAPFDMRILNDFVGSQFFIEFRSGHLDKFEFRFEGNKKANVGEMDFEYSNLKVQKLQGHERYIASRPKTGFFASLGNMLIPANRSSGQKRFKTAAIYYEKEYNRDLIHGTIMSMLSGVLSSLGFSSKNIEKQQQKAAALDDTTLQKSAENAQEKALKAEQQKKEIELKNAKKEERELKKKENN